jgi:serine/threonine protein kinase/Flp pilus assembly protein TadD
MASDPPSRSSREGDLSSSSARREEALERFIDRLNAGEAVDPEEIQRDYPEMAEDIISQLEVFAGFGDAREPVAALGILGDYTLRRQIGRGGMGVVYEAWENSMDRRVALKVLPAGIAADSKACMRFLREAQTAGKLNHPHVVGVYSTGVKEGTPWYSMEFVEGETLAQVLLRIKEAKPEAKTPFGFPRDDVAYYSTLARCFADVADGLQYAHSKGVIHRDIKPSNLILDRDGRLRILDFGLARMEGQESLTLTGDFVGTPLYMSPEQARRKKIPIDHRTDVYSLGATLYELLTFQPPFRGKDHADTLSQIIERDPQDPRKMNSRVPKDLETIALKCLRKEAGDRYGTAEALAQDLRRFSRGEPVEARPCSRWEIGARRAWKNRLRILIATITGILILVSSILGVLFHRDRLSKQLTTYEELVVQSMLRVELSALPREATARLETSAPLPSWLFDLSDFEGVAGDLELTSVDLERQEMVFPRRPEAYYQRSRVLLALERTDEAITELERAIHADENFLPARTVLENLGVSPPATSSPLSAGGPGSQDWRKLWAGASEAARRSEYRSVIDYTSILLDGPALKDAYLGAEIEARLRRADARLKLEDIRAIADLEVIHSRWPSAIEPVLLQGVVLHILGHPAEAEEVFEQVHAALPRKQSTVLWVAGLYLTFNEHAKAERWIERVTSAPTRERLRALRLQAMGDHASAVDAARRAVDLDPGNPRNHHVLASLFDLRDTGQQSAVLENALKLFPRHMGLKEYLCQVRFRQGRYEEGVSLAKEVLQVAPRMAGTRGIMGCCLFCLGRIDEALAALEEASRAPISRSSDIGWARFNLGHLDEARAAYEAANRNDPQDSWCLRFLGMIEARRGRDEEALGFLKKSIGAFPRNGVPEYNLAVFHEERGEMQEALRWYAESYRRVPRGFPHWRLLNLLRSRKSEALDLSALDGLAADLERSAAVPGNFREKQLLARILLLRGHRPEDERRALDLARQTIDVARPVYPEILATLADAQYACGERQAAFRSLEKALSLPHATGGMAEQLESWSKEFSLDQLPIQRSTMSSLSDAMLTQLRETGAIRIDCGGAGLKDSAGRSWLPDAFFHGGWSRRVFEEDNRICADAYGEGEPASMALAFGFHGPVAGTNDPDLYRTERWFHPAEHRPGYMIQVPPGNYRVRLHFVETWYRAEGIRRFGVMLNGRQIIEAMDPFARRGFAVAFVEEAEVAVEHRLIKVEFVPESRYPMIAAIEIVQ